MKKVLSEYFSFSKKERIAVIIVLVLAGGFIVLSYFFGIKKKVPKDNTKLQQQIATLQSNQTRQTSSKEDDNNEWSGPKPSSYTSTNKGELFSFDPNTLDESGWIKLGIREKTAKTIINYRSKGGKFKTPEDLRKIWGLRKDEADRIIPYATVAATNSNYNSYQKTNTPNGKPILLDANTATPEQLRNIPGIGSSIPYRIVKFRDKLGGFLNMLQVKETYGMNDTIFAAILPYLHVLPTTTKKININAASDYDLSGHPYIDKTIARAITIYRTQHGGYKSVEEIKKIVFISEEVYNKIAPYLAVQ